MDGSAKFTVTAFFATLVLCGIGSYVLSQIG